MPAPPSRDQTDAKNAAVSRASAASKDTSSKGNASNNYGGNGGMSSSKSTSTSNYGGINTSRPSTSNSQPARNTTTNNYGGNGGMSPPTGLSGSLRAAVDPGGLYSSPPSYGGPIGGGTRLTRNARFAVADQANFHPAQLQRQPGDAEAMARMANAESANIRNEYGKPNTTALQGTMDVMRNRMLSNQFPDTVQGVISQPKQFSPFQDGLYNRTKASPTDIKLAEGILSGETPSVVGNSLNYANTDYLKTSKGIAQSSKRTRENFDRMQPEATFADVKNPANMHTFGTIGQSDVAFNNATPQQKPDVQYASKATPKYQAPPEYKSATYTPEFEKAVAPLNNAMKYFADNPVKINVANKLGLLKAPVNDYLGSKIRDMQQYLGDFMNQGKGNTQIADTIVNNPKQAIQASPSLKKVAATSPTFLQRVLDDASKVRGNSRFKNYAMRLSKTRTTQGSLSTNDMITNMFAELAAGRTPAFGAPTASASNQGRAWA